LKVVVGTRSSKLARAQTELVVEQLQKLHPIKSEYRLIQTEGDKRFDEQLKTLGGKGAFTSALNEALRDGHIDLAVHSYKDLPTADDLSEYGLQITAIPKRANPSDLLIARQPIDLNEKKKWKIGTSSSRRKCELLKNFPHLNVVPLRGNITTRIQKLVRHDFDGIILAAAGVERLQASVPWFQTLEDSVMLPAPAQGALAIITRLDDDELNNIVSQIDDHDTRLTTEFERRALKITGGGCDAPMGARCVTYAGHLILNVRVYFDDTTTECWEYSTSAPIPESSDDFFKEVEEDFQKAKEKWKQHSEQPTNNQTRTEKKSSIDFSKYKLASKVNLQGKRIAVTRDEDADGDMNLAIRKLDGEPVSTPLIEIKPRTETQAIVSTLKNLPYGSWIVFASKRSVEILTSLKEFEEKDFRKYGFRFAAVGSKTADFLKKCDLTPEMISRDGGAEELLERFENTQEVSNETIFLPQSNKSLPTLKKGFQSIGARVVTETLYEVLIQKTNAQLLCQMVEKNQLHALTFCSPSAVDAFRECWGQYDLPPSIRIASIGQTTSKAIMGKGWTVHAEATKPSIENVATALAEFYAEEKK